MAIYCALGDSMSIDEYAGGAGQGAASLLATRLGHTLHLLARDGATSDDVVNLQLDQLADPPDLVTLTMGGNDLLTALFSPAGPAALAATAMDRLVHKIADNTAKVLDRLVGTGALVVVRARPEITFTFWGLCAWLVVPCSSIRRGTCGVVFGGRRVPGR